MKGAGHGPNPRGEQGGGGDGGGPSGSVLIIKVDEGAAERGGQEGVIPEVAEVIDDGVIPSESGGEQKTGVFVQEFFQRFRGGIESLGNSRGKAVLVFVVDLNRIASTVLQVLDIGLTIGRSGFELFVFPHLRQGLIGRGIGFGFVVTFFVIGDGANIFNPSVETFHINGGFSMKIHLQPFFSFVDFSHGGSGGGDLGTEFEQDIDSIGIIFGVDGVGGSGVIHIPLHADPQKERNVLLFSLSRTKRAAIQIQVVVLIAQLIQVGEQVKGLAIDDTGAVVDNLVLFRRTLFGGDEGIPRLATIRNLDVHGNGEGGCVPRCR